MHRLIMNSETYKIGVDLLQRRECSERSRRYVPVAVFRAAAGRGNHSRCDPVRQRANQPRSGRYTVFPLLAASVRDGYRQGKWILTKEEPATWRRSVYSYWKRGIKYPMFDVHDQPDQNVTSREAQISTVPTQALTLLNNEFVLLQARYLAERVIRETGSNDVAAQVRTLYRIALSREPAATELAGQIDFLRKQREFRAPQATSGTSVDWRH